MKRHLLLLCASVLVSVVTNAAVVTLPNQDDINLTGAASSAGCPGGCPLRCGASGDINDLVSKPTGDDSAPVVLTTTSGELSH
jgi:hypothetical protein